MKLKLTGNQIDELVDAESTIDTLVESGAIREVSPKAYDLFRKALTKLQQDAEKQGIEGKWKSLT